MTPLTPASAPSGIPLAAATARPAAPTRLLFVDNLRVFLTMLVIAHHLLITYAGSGSWYYMEGREDFTTLAIGSWVLSVNQAFFMGLFLFIAAYFVPPSYDRKGPARFLKDRLVRLGIPLALYSWVIAPLFAWLLLGATGRPQPPILSFFPGEYFRSHGPWIGAGPLWFIETLLLLSVVYALWRVARPGRAGSGAPPAAPTANPGGAPPAAPAPAAPAPAAPAATAATRFPANRSIALFALALGLATFLVRLVFPVGWSFRPLNLQLPHFAQYIALFIAGLVAYRQDWLRGLPDRTGRLWLIVGAVLVLAFVPMALLLDAAENSPLFKGGWNIYALIYAFWESAVCVALCTGITWLFRRRANGQGALARYLGRTAYAAFIIHAPIITFLALAFRGVTLYPLLKFAVLALISIPLCFGLGGLLLKVPYADRVL